MGTEHVKASKAKRYLSIYVRRSNSNQKCFLTDIYIYIFKYAMFYPIYYNILHMEKSGSAFRY